MKYRNENMKYRNENMEYGNDILSMGIRTRSKNGAWDGNIEYGNEYIEFGNQNMENGNETRLTLNLRQASSVDWVPLTLNTITLPRYCIATTINKLCPDRMMS